MKINACKRRFALLLSPFNANVMPIEEFR